MYSWLSTRSCPPSLQICKSVTRFKRCGAMVSWFLPTLLRYPPHTRTASACHFIPCFFSLSDSQMWNSRLRSVHFASHLVTHHQRIILVLSNIRSWRQTEAISFFYTPKWLALLGELVGAPSIILAASISASTAPPPSQQLWHEENEEEGRHICPDGMRASHTLPHTLQTALKGSLSHRTTPRVSLEPPAICHVTLSHTSPSISPIAINCFLIKKSKLIYTQFIHWFLPTDKICMLVIMLRISTTIVSISKQLPRIMLKCYIVSLCFVTHDRHLRMK